MSLWIKASAKLLNLNVTLLPLYNFRANASMVLEKQLRKIDSTVSGFEKQLSDDGVIPDKPSAIQIRTQEIQVNTYFILNLVEGILIFCESFTWAT